MFYISFLNLLWIHLEPKILTLTFSYDTLRSQENLRLCVRATRSRTFTLYDYIYKVLCDDSHCERGAGASPSPHRPRPARDTSLGSCSFTARSTESPPRAVRSNRSPINICTTRSRPSLRRFGELGRLAAGLDNTGERRRWCLRAAAAGAAAAGVESCARRRQPAQGPVEAQTGQRQRQRRDACQPRRRPRAAARARLRRLLLAAPAVVEERLHTTHARRVVDARFGTAQARATEPARRQRPGPRALLASASSTSLAHD